MQHLAAERIAALADEPATLAERAHLGECAACNAELAAAQRLVRMAMTDTPAIERPLTSWHRLGPALASEGLIERPLSANERDEDVVSLGSYRSMRGRRLMQAVAGLFLLAGGGVIGRASAAWPVVTDPTVATTTNDTMFKSAGEALTALERASDDYQRAIAFLASNDTIRGRDAAAMYQARLDVFDRAAAEARAALFRAPQDQILNNYYLSTMGARDYTLRQLREAVPVSNTMRTRF